VDLQPGPKGQTTRTVVTANGAGITSYDVKDLPATTGQSDLAALNATTRSSPSQFPTGTTRRTRRRTGCGVGEGDTAHHRFDRERDAAVRNVTFANHVGTLGVATGHIGMNFLLKNVGKRACELDGFPTVQMIGSTRTWSHGSHVRCRLHGAVRRTTDHPNQARWHRGVHVGIRRHDRLRVAKCPAAHTLE